MLLLFSTVISKIIDLHLVYWQGGQCFCQEDGGVSQYMRWFTPPSNINGMYKYPHTVVGLKFVKENARMLHKSMVLVNDFCA